MPTLLELLEQKRKKEQEAKKKPKVVPKVAPETVPKKMKTHPKPTKKPEKPIVIRKEKIGTEYIYTSNNPELVKYKEQINKLEQEQGETRQEFFNRRIKMRLILEEMINKKLGKPVNLENQYRIETGCRPLYRGKRPTYAFMEWLWNNKKVTTKQRKKYEKHYGLFISENVDESKESKEPEEAVEEPEEETTKKEESEKTEAPIQGIVDDIRFMRCELKFLKQQFKEMKSNGSNGNIAPIERIKQDEHRPEINLNKANFGSVIKEMKEIFSRVENAYDLLSPVNGRNLIETSPILA